MQTPATPASPGGLRRQLLGFPRQRLPTGRLKTSPPPPHGPGALCPRLSQRNVPAQALAHLPPRSSGTTQMTGLHLIAGLGLAHPARDLLLLVDKSPTLHADAKDDGRRTALMWAAHHGHVEVVKLLFARSDVRSVGGPVAATRRSTMLRGGLAGYRGDVPIRIQSILQR